MSEPTFTSMQINEILSRHAALSGLIRGATKRGELSIIISLKSEQRALAKRIKIIKAEAALGMLNK